MERASNSYHVNSGLRSVLHTVLHPWPAGSLLSVLRKAVDFTSSGYYYSFTPELECPRKHTCESHSSSSCPLWSDAKLSYDSCRVIGPGLPGGTTERNQKTEKSDLVLNAFFKKTPFSVSYWYSTAYVFLNLWQYVAALKQIKYRHQKWWKDFFDLNVYIQPLW